MSKEAPLLAKEVRTPVETNEERQRSIDVFIVSVPLLKRSLTAVDRTMFMNEKALIWFFFLVVAVIRFSEVLGAKMGRREEKGKRENGARRCLRNRKGGAPEPALGTPLTSLIGQSIKGSTRVSEVY